MAGRIQRTVGEQRPRLLFLNEKFLLFLPVAIDFFVFYIPDQINFSPFFFFACLYVIVGMERECVPWKPHEQIKKVGVNTKMWKIAPKFFIDNKLATLFNKIRNKAFCSAQKYSLVRQWEQHNDLSM